MKLRIALLTAGLTCAAAATAAPPAPPPEGRFCDEHVVKCEEMRERYDSYCKKNPQSCAAGKKRREARRRFCKQNPEECDEMMEERRERMAARREHCLANPVDCDDRYHDEQRRYRSQRQAMRQERRCRMHPEDCERPQSGPEPPRRAGPPR